MNLSDYDDLTDNNDDPFFNDKEPSIVVMDVDNLPLPALEALDFNPNKTLDSLQEVIDMVKCTMMTSRSMHVDLTSTYVGLEELIPNVLEFTETETSLHSNTLIKGMLDHKENIQQKDIEVKLETIQRMVGYIQKYKEQVDDVDTKIEIDNIIELFMVFGSKFRSLLKYSDSLAVVQLENDTSVNLIKIPLDDEETFKKLDDHYSGNNKFVKTILANITFFKYLNMDKYFMDFMTETLQIFNLQSLTSINKKLTLEHILVMCLELSLPAALKKKLETIGDKEIIELKEVFSFLESNDKKTFGSDNVFTYEYKVNLLKQNYEKIERVYSHISNFFLLQLLIKFVKYNGENITRGFYFKD